MISKLTNVIPNFLTFCNAFLGFYSINFSFHQHFQAAGTCILIGVLFDFLDGKTARMLNAHSVLGKELDSFSDFLTFGIAPAFLVFNMLHCTTKIEIQFVYPIICIITFSYAFLTATRLAIFNSENLFYAHVKKIKENDFIGIPSTFAGAIIAFLVTYNKWPKGLFSIEHVNFVSHPYFIFAVLIILSINMVAPVSYPKGFGIVFSFRNHFHIMFNIIAMILFIFLGAPVILTLVIAYLCTPFVRFFIYKDNDFYREDG